MVKAPLLEIALYQDTDKLVDRSLQGDQGSFRALYQQYARAMYNTALRILGNTADAEDVLQESFLEAFRNLARFSRKATFGAWLRKIVIHRSINHLRKKMVVLREPDDTLDEVETEQHDATGEEAALQVENIRKAMGRLSPGFRAVLSLYLFEGYDYEEIAEILGMEQVTVRTQYLRGKKRLLQLISA